MTFKFVWLLHILVLGNSNTGPYFDIYMVQNLHNVHTCTYFCGLWHRKGVGIHTNIKKLVINSAWKANFCNNVYSLNPFVHIGLVECVQYKKNI